MRSSGLKFKPWSTAATRSGRLSLFGRKSCSPRGNRLKKCRKVDSKESVSVDVQKTGVFGPGFCNLAHLGTSWEI